MIRTVTIPPEAQLAPLLDRYRDARAARRRGTLIAIAVLAVAILLSARVAEVDLDLLSRNGGHFFSYFNRTGHLDTGAPVWTDPREWFWGIGRWTRLLGETLLIAYVGTLTGAILAFGVCFLTSRNLVRNAVICFVTRRVLEFCRTVPDIVFALIFVIAFGLGPLPGVLAIAVHTTGALGKLFSEIVESIDMRPVEGIASSGGSWFARIRFGVLPQVMSNFASYALLRFEINVRGAAVIGFVGAGGIGEEMITAIRRFYYSDVSAILLLIMVCVIAIDMLSERVRHRLLAMDGGK